MSFSEQITRIKAKLKAAAEAPGAQNVFGASSHQYRLDPPLSEKEVQAFEEAYHIRLPEAFRAFVTQIGNGGPAYMNSGAGPYYGIYPLGEHMDDFIDDPHRYLRQAPAMFPHMSVAEWEALTGRTQDDDVSDEEYEEIVNTVYSGILPLGSQGCEYLHALVVSGPHAGRVLNASMDLQRPYFCYEEHFLDWYERWLDEILDGSLTRSGAGWFGYNMGGSLEKLLAHFDAHEEPIQKEAALTGMFRHTEAPETVKAQLMHICRTHEGALRGLAVRVLSHFDRDLAAPLLREDLRKSGEERSAAIRGVWEQGKTVHPDWFEDMAAILGDLEAAQDYRYACYVMVNGQGALPASIGQFARHADVEFRKLTFFLLNSVEDKLDYLPIFLDGLRDANSDVVYEVIKALEGISHATFGPAYAALLRDYEQQRQYTLQAVMKRLREDPEFYREVVQEAAEHPLKYVADDARKMLENG